MPRTKTGGFYVDFATRGGDVRVFENEVASITKADLRRLGLSRANVDRAFAEGKEMMKERGLEPGGRIRPVADGDRNGGVFVVLVKEAR
jgi:hypothetical protein